MTDDTLVPCFWDWSLTIYDISGVPDTLLHLQDEFGFDVNLILWCMWAGRYFPGLSAKDVSALLEKTTPWQKTVISNLRDIRRNMKTLNSHVSRTASKEMRRQVKKLELEAEQLHQAHLDEATRAFERNVTTANSEQMAVSYFETYATGSVTLENTDNIRLEENSDRPVELFRKALQLIFPVRETV